MSGTGGWQTQVYDQPAAGIAGVRSALNPIFMYDAGPGGLVSGSSLFTGRFAWVTQPFDPNGTPSIANSFGNGAPQGFLLNNQQGTNTIYLSYAGQQLLPGQQCALMTGGDTWVVNDGTTLAVPGQKAFAYVATGKVAFAAAGTVFGGASATGSSIATSTSSVTATITAGIMAVSAVGSGTVVSGTSISGTGIPTNPAPQVVAQLTGTAGGVGTYALNQNFTVATATTVSGTYGTLTIGTATGAFAVGDTLTFAAGAPTSGPLPVTITQNLTGSGGSGGTMVVNNNTAVSSTTITASFAVETKFFARSTGLAGEIVKMSSYTDAGGL